MTQDASRRFTDREVAIVLRKAAEIEETEGSGEGGGLSLDDLRDIGREVGISAESIGRAVAELDHRRPLRPRWFGAPLTRKSVHAVAGRLEREGLAELVRVVDELTDSAGTISEALGSVRWTSSDRLKSSFVSITPDGGETTIQVVEKTLPRIRRLFHFLPAAWAVMIAAPVIGAAGMGALPTAAAAGVSALVGSAVGRGAWQVMSSLSAKRVERLGEELARAADSAAARARDGRAP